MARRPPLSVYLPSLTSLLVLAGLSAYYLTSRSARAEYLDERAFRVLALLGRSVSGSLDQVRTVMGASTNVQVDPDAYVSDFLEEYSPRDVKRHMATGLGREGVLRLSALERSPDLDLRVEYTAALDTTRERQRRPAICEEAVPAICATIKLAPVVARRLALAEDELFDDILIADGTGTVWYQQSNRGRVVDLASLVPPAASGTGQRAASPQSPPTGSSSPGQNDRTGVSPVTILDDYSAVLDVTIGDSEYRLYTVPLSETLWHGESNSQLVIAGLRRRAPSEEGDSVLPHAYIIWSGLAVLTLFALSWPLLKLFYMSPKERLQHRHLAYLLASVFGSAALLTLLILNGSYTLRERREGDEHLKTLAKTLKSNFDDELGKATRFLAKADPAAFSAQAPASGELHQVTNALTIYPTLRKQEYPYFHYLFWLNKEANQRLKLTVSRRATPSVNVSSDAYFQDVVDGNLATLKMNDEQFHLRLEPLFSPNTHQFFVVIAMPQRGWQDVTTKVLALKLESLFAPIFPPGYGFAVTDPAGNVKFHSNFARNLQENFLEEAQHDTRLSALLAQSGHGFVRIDYLGQPHHAYVTRLTDVAATPLSLIVFRDETAFSTLNVAVIFVFGLLIAVYALPLMVIGALYLVRRIYPLEDVWPCSSRMPFYIDVVNAHVVTLTAFVMSHALSSPVHSLIGWPLVFIYVATIYPQLVAPARPPWLQWSGRVLLAVALLVMASTTWAAAISAGVITMFLLWSYRRNPKWTGGVSLRHLYALVTLTTVTVSVVAPAFSLFKFSYDAIQRVAVMRTDWLVAEALKKRDHRIAGYYHSLGLDDLATRRLDETLDRYDLDLLGKAPEGSLRSPLELSWIETPLAAVAAKFPPNKMGAELQHAALGGLRDPQRDWRIAPIGSRASTAQPNAIVLDDRGSGRVVRVAAAVPNWTGLEYPGIVGLVLVLGGLYLWFAFLTRTVFLVDLENAPELEPWDTTKTPGDYNLVVIGGPKSGRRHTIKRLPDIEMIDLAKVGRTKAWDQVAPTQKRVALYYFDFDLDDTETNYAKLQLLERLLYVEHRGIILLSTVDPMHYMTALHQHERAMQPGANTPPADRIERWAAVFAKLRKVRLPNRRSLVFDSPRLYRDSPDQARSLTLIKRECESQGVLQRIGRRILLRTQTKPLSDEALIELLLDHADAYYRLLWSGCTAEERLVLFQLAMDGWANPKNAPAIQQLQRRGLVKRDRGFRVMNESFRRFVLRGTYPAEIRRWEQEERASIWRALRLSAAVGAALFACWIVWAYPSVPSVLVSSMTLVTALIGGLVRIVGDLRSNTTVATTLPKP